MKKNQPASSNMSNQNGSVRINAETITPLSARLRKEVGPDPKESQRHHRLIAFALVGFLIFILVGGGLLLLYLAKNPFQTQERARLGSPEQTRAEAKRDAPTAATPQPPPAATRLAEDKKIVDYQEALRIDSDSQKAHEAFEHVDALSKEAQFQRLMSEGLAAYHKNDYAVAHARLLQAKSLKPDSREVVDAISQMEQTIRLHRITQLQQQTQIAEQSENWQDALTAYLAVLALDPNIQFAVQGKERALAQIHITQRMDTFFSRPEALEADSQLKNALLLLDQAQSITPQGPRLAAQIKELEKLTRLAQTPVKVIIVSDNLTHITVYRVGKLGPFLERELNLRPGTYTVVGARNGYQDVRQTLAVKPGQQAVRLTVICRVKI